VARNKKTVIVCHGTGCVSSGSPAITKRIKKEIKKTGLKDIEVKLTGCHGFCQRGPVVIIEPDHIFYPEVTTEVIPEIVNSHLQSNTPVEHLFYRDPITSKPIPYYTDIPFYNKQKRLITLL